MKVKRKVYQGYKYRQTYETSGISKFCKENALVANQKQEGARNHTSDEPALVSLNRFNHILNDSTYGCCFIIEQNELRIIKTNSTIFNCLGLTEYQVKDRCFIDFIHPDDKQLVKDMVSPKIWLILYDSYVMTDMKLSFWNSIF